MFCNSCKNEIPNEAKICPVCGVPVAGNDANPQYQYGAPQQQNAPYNAPYAAPAEQAPETTKPRSAYMAAILHLVFPLLGLGYFYRGNKEKGKNCIIMFIVGAVTSFLFGIGAILIAIVSIINLIEGVKLFKGEYPVDSYGRKLYQEF